MKEFKLFWGDSHTNLHSRHIQSLDEALTSAKEMLDFWPLAYYPQEYQSFKGFEAEDWLEQSRIDEEWRAICEFAAKNNLPGEFVIFAGYEWQGDGHWGDHNVFHLKDHQPLVRVNTIEELYAEIKNCGAEALAIPHHTAYIVGIRGKDWNVLDESLSPFVEIFSQHGCSESDEEWIGLRVNRHMGPGFSGGTVEEALERGYKIGIICSGDSHYGFPAVYGYGLMGCYARELTRESLWEAFKARRVYGVSADRIKLLFTVEGAMMGEVIQKSGAVTIEVHVKGSDAIDRIELLRNNQVIAAYCHLGKWDMPSEENRVRCKLRVEAGWGPRKPERLSQTQRQWECTIEVDNGTIVSVEKCWRNPGQYVGPTGRSKCEFGFLTGQHPGPDGLPNESTIFEIEAMPQDKVKLTLEGRAFEMTLNEAMRRSRIVFFREEVEEFLRESYGLEPHELPRDDPFYFLSNKAKIHRAIPEVGYTASFTYYDESPPRSTNFYRVRVYQRNGSVAWSSPIWVENE